MVGLSYIPEQEDMEQQYYPDIFNEIATETEPIDYFSYRNRDLLASCMFKLGLHKPDPAPSRIGGILEIGIGQEERFLNTSTFILTAYKHYWNDYCGIDRGDRKWLKEISGNIELYESESIEVLEIFKEYFYWKPFVLLHIDGDHSVEGVIIDWQFSQFVRDNGIILLHDIKAHPGPKLLVDAIDRDVYTVHKMFLDDPKDFGMAVIYKKENDYSEIVHF